MRNILDISIDDFSKDLVDHGFKKFRAKQIHDWLYKGIENFEDTSNLSSKLIGYLDMNYRIQPVSVLKVYASKIDGTKKYLLKLHDDQVIEAVFMKYKHGNTLCVTTQVGCRMGCTFCASTIGGLSRNLTKAELIGQILAVQKHTGERISNVVLMGSGEPLDNYKEVVEFVKLANDEKGLNISQRNITLSTCGLVDEIYMLADENLKITLAISLHAPNDDLRTKMMPINKKYNIETLIKACKHYVKETSRRITFEYTLVDGVNDSVKEANELSYLLRGLLCHVNLIPINEVKERSYKASKQNKIHKFEKILSNNGINVTVRRELGDDIDAACGQLRNNYMEDKDLSPY